MQPTNNKSSADSKKENGRWSKEQHQRFMLGLMQYGKNWKKVQEIVATRSGSQVRSHAQKFFNKLQKTGDNKKSKKDKKNQEFLQMDQDVSFTQNNDMVKSLNSQYSNITPPEIISLIKKQSQDNRKVSLSNFKKTLEKQEKQNNVHQQEKDSKQIKNVEGNLNGQTPFKLNSYKSMNNILSAYEALNEADPQNLYEDESFLIGITKKYKRFFSKGGQFQNLIDFGNPHQVAKAIQIGKSQRKKSWTLVQGFQGDQNDLQNFKKQIKQVPKQQKVSQQNNRQQSKDKTENSKSAFSTFKQTKKSADEKVQKVKQIQKQIDVASQTKKQGKNKAQAQA